MKEKLNQLQGSSSGYANTLPLSVRKRVSALELLQDKSNALDVEYKKEIAALERKYLSIRKPLYEQRASIISGNVEPSEFKVDGFVSLEDQVEGDQVEGKADDNVEVQVQGKGIPHFWYTVLTSHPDISEIVSPSDESLLKHLTDIQFSFLEEGFGYSLDFVFEENSIIADKRLTKTYFLELGDIDGSFMYTSSKGCTINWKEGQSLVSKTVTKSTKTKGTDQVRTISKTVPCQSFFSFFETLSGDDEELEDKLEVDFEIGEIFKSQIIPNAVQWFTGEAAEYSYDEESEEEVPIDEDEEDEEYEFEEPAGKQAQCNQQ